MPVRLAEETASWKLVVLPDPDSCVPDVNSVGTHFPLEDEEDGSSVDSSSFFSFRDPDRLDCVSAFADIIKICVFRDAHDNALYGMLSCFHFSFRLIKL